MWGGKTMKSTKSPKINMTRPGNFTKIIMRSSLLRLRLRQCRNITTTMRFTKVVSTISRKLGHKPRCCSIQVCDWGFIRLKLMMCSSHPPDQVLLQDLEVSLQSPLLDVLKNDRTIGTIGLGADADLDGLPLQGLLGAGCLPGGGIAGALLLPWGLPYRQPWPAYRSRPRGHGGGSYFPWGIPSHQPWPADGNRPRGRGGRGVGTADFAATVWPIGELSEQPVLELQHPAIVGVAVEGHRGFQVLQLLFQGGGDQAALESCTGHRGQAVEISADCLPKNTKARPMELSEQPSRRLLHC